MERHIMDGTIKSFDILNDDKVSLELRKEITDNSKQFKPCQIGIFVLAYSKRIMNEAIDAIGGFDSFEKTFWYTDTDSMIITMKQLAEIKQKTNSFGDSFVGNQLGQLHDDLGDEAVIIRGLWVQPKLYCLEYLVKEKDGYHKKVHVRSKGVNLKQNPLSVADFERLLNDEKINVQQWQFKRVKEDNNITIETRHSTKTIGGRWEGRTLVGDCWLPKGSTYHERNALPVYS
eukprot:Lithocolla_globosa_v1_NODE_2643_length_1922_cov_2.867167.p2 type:complete len:231 gc:universal NODE_2643_length_1922_cov_2.867167:956-1648(+)